MEATIRAAKKILKKEDLGSLKLKVLSKSVAEKIGDVETSDVKGWILASDKFIVNGKDISLAKASKKRKSDDEKSAKKAAKKAKKESKTNNSGSSGTETSVSSSKGDLSVDAVGEWRTEHKIVLMGTTDDEDGNKISAELNTNAAYIPYNNFNSDRVKSSVNEAFLHQCTVVNGFTKPSAIQAQCWPVMLHPGSDGKRRDIVG